MTGSKALRPSTVGDLPMCTASPQNDGGTGLDKRGYHPEEHTMTTYQPTLSAALAHEHLTELLRQAATSRQAAQAPTQNPHRTPRRRQPWWAHLIARRATPRIA